MHKKCYERVIIYTHKTGNMILLCSKHINQFLIVIDYIFPSSSSIALRAASVEALSFRLEGVDCIS